MDVRPHIDNAEWHLAAAHKQPDDDIHIKSAFDSACRGILEGLRGKLGPGVLKSIEFKDQSVSTHYPSDMFQKELNEAVRLGLLPVGLNVDIRWAIHHLWRIEKENAPVVAADVERAIKVARALL